MAKNKSYELKFQLDNNAEINAGTFIVPGGLDALMYSGVHEVSAESDINTTAYTLEKSKFSRVPEATETFMQIIKVIATANVYVALCKVVSISGDNVSVQLIAGTNQLIRGPKGAKGDKGDPFTIAKVFSSVSAMQAGAATDGVAVGAFVTVDTGNVNDEDNAKLYYKASSAVNGYRYLTDLSGAQGIQGPKGDTGETPNISANATIDANVGSPKVDVSKTGTNEDPQFTFAFKNLKGAGIDSIDLQYQQTDNTDIPTSGWAPAQPSPIAGKYMHYKMTLTFTDNSTPINKYWCVRNGSNGSNGANGADGDRGPQGVSVKSASITEVVTTE